MWSDETKLKLFGINANHHVWCGNNTGLHLKNTIHTVKYRVETLCFGASILQRVQDQLSVLRKGYIGPSMVRFWPITSFRETPPSIRALRI